MELNSNKAYSVTSTQVTKVSLLCIVLSAFLQMLFGANVPVWPRQGVAGAGLVAPGQVPELPIQFVNVQDSTLNL